MISSPEPSANNMSPVFSSSTSQPHSIPLTLPFFLIDSLPGLAFMVLPYPGSTPTSPTVPSSHPVATPNPSAVPLRVASHKAQSLAHFCSQFTLPHALSSILNSTSVSHHLYADDTQLFISFSPSVFSSSVNLLQSSISQVYLDVC